MWLSTGNLDGAFTLLTDLHQQHNQNKNDNEEDGGRFVDGDGNHDDCDYNDKVEMMIMTVIVLTIKR